MWVRTACGSRNTAEDLVALLTVAGLEGQADIAERLRERFERVDKLSTIVLAQALLAAETWRENVRPWVDELLRRQRSDGSWKSARLAEESVAVTAWAVRALSPWRDEASIAQAADHGLAYLRSTLCDLGWDSPALASTYVLTAVLRALATGLGDPALSENGLHRLRQSQRADGGWGGGPGEPSSSEHTAAAVIALAESDAFRYVPARPALRAVSEMSGALDELNRRQKATAADIEAQVEDRAAQILADRDRLRKEIDDLRKVADLLRVQIPIEGSAENPYPANRRNALYPASRSSADPYRASRSSVTVLRSVLAVVITAVGTAVAGIFANSLTTGMSGTSLLLVGISVLGSIGVLFLSPKVLDRARSRQALHLSSIGTAASELMDGFVVCTEELTARELQDVAYELISEGAELPRDYARRFFRERFYRQNPDPTATQWLRTWMEDYVNANEDVRKEFLSRLRKTVS